MYVSADTVAVEPVIADGKAIFDCLVKVLDAEVSLLNTIDHMLTVSLIPRKPRLSWLGLDCSC